MKLEVLPGLHAMCRMPDNRALPAIPPAGFFSVTATGTEISLVCAQELVPDGCRAEKDWRILRVSGTLDFSLVGVMANLATILAGAGVAICALSTFDTDYLLVKEERLASAVAALREAGLEVVEAG